MNDDVAIGNRKNFNGGNRDKDFNSKEGQAFFQVPDNCKNIENGGFHSSSGGESEKKHGEQGTENDEERISGVGGKSEYENSGNRMIPDKKKLAGDDDVNNVGGGDQGKWKGKRGRMELMNARDLNGVGEEKPRIVAGMGIKGLLGISKYASLFEVHEVEGEVLLLLTLEDLKYMGVNAVCLRRKMCCSIKKLGKGV